VRSLQYQIVLVSADPASIKAVKEALDARVFRVLAIRTVAELRARATEAPDLIILDAPAASGPASETYAALRAIADAPILSLAANPAPEGARAAEHLRALPLRGEELRAQVERMLGIDGPASGANEAPLIYGELSISLAERRLSRSGALVRLSRIEWALLSDLLRHAGTTRTHAALLRQVWGPTYDEAKDYLHVYIYRLRQKIEPDPARPRYLLSVPGLGYRFARPEPDAASAPAAPPEATSPLPLPPTPLIGREGEMAQARRLLSETRVALLTLTGAGGSGKTRLAQELAHALGTLYPDGVVFVALADLTDARQVFVAVAQATGLALPERAPLIAALGRALRERQMLLVLDNFEHLAAAARELAELLALAPRLQALVTSRTPLRIRAEHELPVLPLGYPDLARQPSVDAIAAAPAVQLFVARARAVRHDFQLHGETALAVAAICARLGGLPLAIELAVPWLRALEPATLLAQLDQQLSVLVDGPRDLPTRQHTIRDTIAWSYRLLPPAAQRLFAVLGVFRGGVTLEAIAAVWRKATGDAPDAAPPTPLLAQLAMLVDHQLLQRATGERAPRYTMLESVQAFAQAQLASDPLADRAIAAHRSYYHAFVSGLSPLLGGSTYVDGIAQLSPEYPNVRAALASLIETGDIAAAEELASWLWIFWRFRPRMYTGEAEPWIGRILAVPPRTIPHRANLHRCAGLIAQMKGEYAQAEAQFARSLDYYQQLGDQRNIGYLSGRLATMYHAQGRIAEAHQAYQRSAALLEGWRGPDVATITLNLSILLCDQGQLAQAQQVAAQSLEHFRALGHPRGTAYALRVLGDIAVDRDAPQEALARYRESLGAARETVPIDDYVGILDGLAAVALLADRASTAALLFGAADALCAQQDVPRFISDAQRYARFVDRGARAIGDEAWRRGIAAGRAISVDEALEAAAMLP
jgi:predicted ATPase/DNA-binding response OmpR family regulator